MNMEQANAIPMSEILDKVGCKIGKSSSYDLMYFSPFRDEKTASFHVNTMKNRWFDFGMGCGGTVIDFVCRYLEMQQEDHTPSDGLRWVNNMMKPSATVITFPTGEPQEVFPALKFVSAKPLQALFLLDYLKERGIPSLLAKKHLKEVRVRNTKTKRELTAIGFKNADGGFELRNSAFKGSLSPKGISLVRGKELMPESLHVFEGFLDFLSALMYQSGNAFRGDAIILNSVGCLPKAVPYILNYSYRHIYSWLDNDTAGRNATQVLKEFAEDGRMKFTPMNSQYATHKDVNAWHMNKLSLTPPSP